MPNNTSSSAFPATRQTLSELKETAADAASDLASAASVHASKAKGHLQDLAGHLQEEGGEQIYAVRDQFNTVVKAAKDYASERPLACIGVALAVGFLFGLSRRSNSGR
jgi:ElaB/YqjD/DUF883 family membrane-anchored ribosome-binding protein